VRYERFYWLFKENGSDATSRFDIDAVKRMHKTSVQDKSVSPYLF